MAIASQREQRVLVPGQDVGSGPSEAAGGAAAGAEGCGLFECGGAARPAALLLHGGLTLSAEEGEARHRLPGVG